MDLQHKPKPPDPPMRSISHIAHSWKAPVTEDYASDPPNASECVARHILFGHAGDMSDPRKNLQISEFAPCSRYFFQDPKGVKMHTLSADRFSNSSDPLKCGGSSVITSRIKANWGPPGEQRRSHSIPPGQMYRSQSEIHFSDNPAKNAPRFERHARPYRDFTGGYDAVKLFRTEGR